jgi:hypothetical protein
MIKREFIVERQGRSFVLYAGLLDLAHTQGLRAIRTRIVQIPSDDNGQTAIASAEVETDRGTFSGLGDANPTNVSRAMLNCTIRLAETRAKARALRDAVNVGVAAFEELGDLDEASLEPMLQSRNDGRPLNGAATLDELVTVATGNNGAGANGAANGAANGSYGSARAAAPAPGAGVATPAQVRAIYSIARDQHSLSELEVDEKAQALFGAAPLELSRKQASEFITTLKGSR